MKRKPLKTSRKKSNISFKTITSIIGNSLKSAVVTHAIGTLTSLFCSIFLLQWFAINSMGGAFNKVPLLLVLIILLLLISIFVVPYAVVVVSLIAVQIGREERNKQLTLILSSYLSITLIFAGIYYSISLQQDYNRSLSEYYSFPSHPAFDGVNLRLFSLGEQEITADDLDRALTRFYESKPTFSPAVPFEKLVSFQPAARMSVFIDCLYLSVTSMTLFGYGAVQPLSTYARLANSLKLASAAFLIVFSLGMLFTDWWSKG